MDMNFRVVASLLVGAVAVAGGIAGGVVAGTSGGGPKVTVPKVTVPDVVGVPALKAAARIERAHLETVCRDAHRRGTVVEQQPAAGSGVARGSIVTIFSGDGGCSSVRPPPAVAAPSTTTSTTTTTSTSRSGAVAKGLNPIPPRAAVHTLTVAFVDLTVGYLLVSATTGKRCEIAVEKTTDGGTDLGEPVPVAPCSSFTQSLGLTESVRLAADDHGDAFVYGSALFATHDGGSTWQAVPEPGRVLDVEAVGSSVWMFVGQCRTPSCWVALTVSTDGGASWHASPVEPPILVTTTDPQLVRLSALSAYVLTAPGRNAFGEPDTVPMWFTADGGRSWLRRDVTCPIDSGDVVMAAAPTGKLFAVCAAEPGGGSQPKSVVDSTNGGASWSPSGPCTTTILKGRCTAKPLINGYLGTLVSTTSTVVYLTGHRSPIYRTTNGGETWTAVGGTPGNTALTFFGRDDGLMLSDTSGRTLMRTDNGGATWTRVVSRR